MRSRALLRLAVDTPLRGISRGLRPAKYCGMSASSFFDDSRRRGGRGSALSSSASRDRVKPGSPPTAGPSAPTPTADAVAPPPRLLDQRRHAIRLRHYAIRTEQAYVDWARRYIRFHERRHPREMEAAQVEAFLTHLAVERGIAPATQNQAKAALLFLYREVLLVDLPWLDDVVVAKERQRLPTVLTQPQVRALLHEMSGTTGQVAALLYGTGMRLLEALRLRVKDVGFERREIVVRHGKGGKDRVTVLPENLMQPLQAQLAQARSQHDRDLQAGWGDVWLPDALAVKFPRAPKGLGLAVGVSQRGALDRSAFRHRAQAPFQRGHGAEGDGRRSPACGHRAALLAARAAPFVRHPPAAGRLRHTHRAGAARPQRHEDDDDLHPCAQSRRARRVESALSDTLIPPGPRPSRWATAATHLQAFEKSLVLAVWTDPEPEQGFALKYAYGSPIKVNAR